MTSAARPARRLPPEAIDRLFGTIAGRYRRGGAARREQVARSVSGLIDDAIATYPGQVFLYAAAIDALLERKSAPADYIDERIEHYLTHMESAALRPQLWDADVKDIRRSGNMLLRLADAGRLPVLHRVLDVLECHIYEPAEVFPRTYKDLSRLYHKSMAHRRSVYARRDVAHDAQAVKRVAKQLSSPGDSSKPLRVTDDYPAHRPDDVNDAWRGYECQRPAERGNPVWENWMND